MSELNNPEPLLEKSSYQSKNVATTSVRYKIYKIRWFMLFLQAMCATCMAMQFLQFSIIANIIVNFYNVSYEAVEWSTMLFMLIYIPCILPAMYITDKIGIRASLLLTMAGSCAAAWIKVGSVAPDRYWVVLLGQVVVSIFQDFIMVLPARFAAAWFGKNQVALACGLGVFGIQLGSAFGCLMPAVVVRPSKTQDDVAYDLYTLNIGFAITCSIFLVLIYAFFRSEPPTPPSGAQKQLEEIPKLQLKQCTKHLFTNVSYVLLVIASGIGVGISYTIPTMLNQIILEYYPEILKNSSEDTGRIGLLMLVMGMFGVTVCGHVLDKFERYKLTTVMVMAFYLLSMIAFTLALHHSMTAVYISSIVLGFFMTATYSICLEVAAEITYPIPETTSSGYILASAQAFGIAQIYQYSHILHKFGALWANSVTCAELLLSTILVMCMKFKLNRRVAEELQNKMENIERDKEMKQICTSTINFR